MQKEVISRLKRERAEVMAKYYQQGQKSGIEWIQDVHYIFLAIIVDWKTKRDEDILSHLTPLCKTIPEELYFERNEGECPFFETFEWPEERFEMWLQGWLDGVMVFWNVVRKEVLSTPIQKNETILEHALLH